MPSEIDDVPLLDHVALLLARGRIYDTMSGQLIDMNGLLRVSQVVAAVGVVLIAIITFSPLPQPYPTWPTLGAVPINPELVAPGILGCITLVVTIRDGISISSAVVGILSVVTLWLAATSLYALYASTAGGVFFGGLFTLVSGIILAVGVVIKQLLGQRESHDSRPHIKERPSK
ncbi:hypothetical protein [Halonotius pteroides]|uniref:hypothetical protein n=1 Tax=Halonotius pteroides TaxID=268735 RepID=UPI00197A9D44|nr:hypothetical protein [Halonotius pteroides]